MGGTVDGGIRVTTYQGQSNRDEHARRAHARAAASTCSGRSAPPATAPAT